MTSLLRELARCLRLEQISPSAEAACQDRTDGALSVRSRDREAHPLDRGLILIGIEPDEEGTHRSVIEHVGSPVMASCVQDFMRYTF